ncbi:MULTISPECIES: hypothetical protein [unclassified Mycolicibacterium]|uniref:hypothetical protein n=1 Tax=unclassified Mycolicibacterium TaxID=2636767 RepID=UPI0012DFB892|nr:MULTISPECIES: hypothetical protein [unclassified Mycolicibacterium]
MNVPFQAHNTHCEIRFNRAAAQHREVRVVSTLRWIGNLPWLTATSGVASAMP